MRLRATGALRLGVIPRPASRIEDLLSWHLRVAGLPEPEREYRFSPPRRWRFDFAWPTCKVAAEAEGGTWRNGRHTRGKGYEADCEKYNTATHMGWRVFRFTSGMVKSGEALATIERALK